jgi:cephalosporin hydroxylase
MLTALIFPALLLETAYLQAQAAERGERVLTASSEPAEVGLPPPATHRLLPRMDAADFAARLLTLLRDEAIEIIYCPHERCYAAVAAVLDAAALPVRLCNGLPHYTTPAVHTSLRNALSPIYAAHQARSSRQPCLSPDQLAAYLRLAVQIPGQSHFLKLATLGVLAATLPSGDWVEIGVAAGRSTVFLTLVAQHFGLGPLLAIDPLDAQEAKQHIAALDADMAQSNPDPRRSFTLNLLPYARGQVGFLPMPAAAAATQYHATRQLGEAPFGPVQTQGRIALLHIDGNHELAKVQADLALWTPHLLPDAWLVVDDYVWHYGDGPKLATDAWLANNQARVAEQWVADRAMFIRIKS